MTQRIDQLTEPPRVGRSYSVPCLVPRNFDEVQALPSLTDVEKLWVSGIRPVLLPHHSDPELGEPIGHYHTDLRFLSTPRLQAFTDFVEETLKYKLNPSELLNFVNVYPQSICDEIFSLEWQDLRCYRAMPKFPPDFPLLQRGFEYLQSFIGQPLDCGRCPHRGVAVAAAPRQGGNQVVCPGHGLIIDLEQGRVVGTSRRPFEPKLCVFLLFLRQIQPSSDYLESAIECAHYYQELEQAAELELEEMETQLDVYLNRIKRLAGVVR